MCRAVTGDGVVSAQLLLPLWQRGLNPLLRREFGAGGQVLHGDRGKFYDDGSAQQRSLLPVTPRIWLHSRLEYMRRCAGEAL